MLLFPHLANSASSADKRYEVFFHAVWGKLMRKQFLTNSVYYLMMPLDATAKPAFERFDDQGELIGIAHE